MQSVSETGIVLQQKGGCGFSTADQQRGFGCTMTIKILIVEALGNVDTEIPK
jgi:hypothetical protein